METYQLSERAVRLLYGLLRDHQSNLIQNEGESWQPDELDLTDHLVYAFGEALD